MRLALWRAGKAKAAVQRAVPRPASVEPASVEPASVEPAPPAAPVPAVARNPAPVAAADSGDLDMRALGAALARKRGWIIVPTVLALAMSVVAVNLVTPATSPKPAS